MDFSEKLKEENIDLNDKEKVCLLQRFYQTGYDAGMHATHKNIEYNEMFVDVVSQLIDFFKMTNNPVQLQQLSDMLKHLKEFKTERGYL